MKKDINNTETEQTLSSNNEDNNLNHDSDDILLSNNVDEIIELQKELEALKEKNKSLHDKYLRSESEIQNIHKRNIEELKKIKDYSISDFAKEMLTVKDYLEMALNDKSNNIESIKIGVELTLKQLNQIFEMQKIKEISSNKCEKLNPNLHHAVSKEQTNEQEQDTIVNTLQRGYLLHDRVLRPAMVTVATNIEIKENIK